MAMTSTHEIWSYLNKIYGVISDDDATSDANDDATPCILDSEDDGYESDTSTSLPTTSPHCFMSHGDPKVFIGGVIVHCDDPNFELVCRLSKALRNELAKTSKLEKRKLISKDHI